MRTDVVEQVVFPARGAPSPRRADRDEDEDDKDEEEKEEEDEEEDEDRKPKGGLLGGIERSNPNHEKKAERMLKVKDLTGAPVAVDPDAGMNRKERYVRLV